MRLNRWKCDMCSTEYQVDDEVLASVLFHIENDSDPVDGHNIRVFSSVDLCPKCKHDLFQGVLNDHPMEYRQKVGKAWKAKRR